MHLPTELISSTGLCFRRVHTRPFYMGCPTGAPGWQPWEGPRRAVTLRHDYWLSVTPVTQRQYTDVIGVNPTAFPAAGDEAAVDSVSWHDAVTFCQRLTDRDRTRQHLPRDWCYRLPNEAQWEYACRAGDAPMPGIEDMAWYSANASRRPQPVGSKQPNAWGFHDMLGNVWEWCANPFAARGDKRAVRGASWFNSARACRPFQRDGWQPTNRGRYVGLRVLASPEKSIERDTHFAAAEAESHPSLHTALADGDLQLAEALLKRDPTLLSSPDEIPPPLHWAIYQQQPEVARWLVQQGADLSLRDPDHDTTPMVCATLMGQHAIVELLAAAGAPTDGARNTAERGRAGEFETWGLSASSFEATLQLLDQLRVT